MWQRFQHITIRLHWKIKECSEQIEQGDQKFGKIAQLREKVAKTVAKDKIYQNIYNKAQLESPKQLHPTTFETSNKSFFKTEYLGSNVKIALKNVAQNVAKKFARASKSSQKIDNFRPNWKVTLKLNQKIGVKIINVNTITCTLLVPRFLF